MSRSDNNATLARAARLVVELLDDHVGIGQPYSARAWHDEIDVQMRADAIAAIGWFYLLEQAAVTAYVSDETTAWLTITGTFKDHKVRATIVYHDRSAVELVRERPPSVHLARRLQVVGAR